MRLDNMLLAEGVAGPEKAAAAALSGAASSANTGATVHLTGATVHLTLMLPIHLEQGILRLSYPFCPCFITLKMS